MIKEITTKFLMEYTAKFDAAHNTINETNKTCASTINPIVENRI